MRRPTNGGRSYEAEGDRGQPLEVSGTGFGEKPRACPQAGDRENSEAVSSEKGGAERILEIDERECLMDQSTRNSVSQDVYACHDVCPDQVETDEMIRDMVGRFARCDTEAKVRTLHIEQSLSRSPDGGVTATASTLSQSASIVSGEVCSSLSEDDALETPDTPHDEIDHGASVPPPLPVEMVRQIIPEPHHHLSRKELVNLRNGWLFANHVGYPLNTKVTIVWRSADGVVAKAWDDNKKLEDELFHSLQTFCGERHLPLAYVWAMENLEVGGWGPHTHILLHLPADQQKALMEKLHRRLIRAGGFSEQNAVDIGVSHAANRIGGLRYIAKGAFPFEIVTYLGQRIYLRDLPSFQHPLEPQGRVPRRKRAGSSHQLGKQARRLAGWKEVNDLLWLSESATIHDIWYRVRPKLRWSPDARGLVAGTLNPVH
jgi:hypothetical protein